MLEEIGVTVNISALPEIRALRETQARLDARGWLWRVLHRQEYNRLLADVRCAIIAADMAMFNAIMDKAQRAIDRLTLEIAELGDEVP